MASLIITWNFLFFDIIINGAHYFAARKIIAKKIINSKNIKIFIISKIKNIKLY